MEVAVLRMQQLLIRIVSFGSSEQARNWGLNMLRGEQVQISKASVSNGAARFGVAGSAYRH
jgi:hypothetical protein